MTKKLQTGCMHIKLCILLVRIRKVLIRYLEYLSDDQCKDRLKCICQKAHFKHFPIFAHQLKHFKTQLVGLNSDCLPCHITAIQKASETELLSWNRRNIISETIGIRKRKCTAGSSHEITSILITRNGRSNLLKNVSVGSSRGGELLYLLEGGLVISQLW